MVELDTEDPDATIRRIRGNAIAVLVVLTVGFAVFTRSPMQVVAVVASGLLMLLNFQGLVSVTNRLLDGEQTSLNGLQMAFLLGRYVLLGIMLCAIVLLPGVGPIPVALGLSILVVAILLEAVLQLFSGPSRRP